MDEIEVHGGDYSDEDVVHNMKSRASRKKVCGLNTNNHANDPPYVLILLKSVCQGLLATMRTIYYKSCLVISYCFYIVGPWNR